MQALRRGKSVEVEPRGLKAFVVFQHVDPEWNLTSLYCSVQRWRSAAASRSRMKSKAQSTTLKGPSLIIFAPALHALGRSRGG